MRKIAYVILVTVLLANMDWQPIHYQWWHNGQWPSWALGNFQNWSLLRTATAMILCPPCGAMAENYYYVLMEHDAGEEEQAAVLKAEYSHNPINPHGDWSFYWGQGEGRPWRRVGMLSFYLWWLPYTVIWWYGWKFIFRMFK